MNPIPPTGSAPTAWLFPGHGSQYRGMGRGFPFDAPAVRPVFDTAEALCGLPLRELAVQGTSDQLMAPEVLEPLLAAFALACAAQLQARGANPAAVLGYSAGMLPALHVAGVIERDAALLLAARRGRLLGSAATLQRDTMGSCIGLSMQAVCATLAPFASQVDIAGWNAPDHFSLVGDPAVLKQLAGALQRAGATWLPVDVAGAWHSRAAADVAEKAAALTADIVFSPPSLPFYCSASGARESDPLRLRASLARQLRMPVLWLAALSALRAERGIDRFVEVGCGRALQGITRRAAKSGAGNGSVKGAMAPPHFASAYA